MKTYGEIPAGKSELKLLLYPFYNIYPFKLWSKYRWRKNSNLNHYLPSLNQQNRWITVINRLGARGDTLITANVIRCIKNQYPKIKINCITPYSELIEHDPIIDSINKPETFYSFDSSYFELIVRNEKNENIIAHNLKRLKIVEYSYKSSFYLTENESSWAENQIRGYRKPLIAISTRSKEESKNWPTRNWIEIIKKISDMFTIIHLGDEHEPVLKRVERFAGRCSMRQSASLLSKCQLFVGPDSLLMHVANGLDVKSIIIFGDAKPVNCLGYSDNINLASSEGSWQNRTSFSDEKNQELMFKIKTKTVLSSILFCTENAKAVV